MPASPTTDQIIRTARQKGLVVPAFNIPYLPMMEPVVRAIVDQDCFALIETARLEWIKFEARSAAAVMKEYQKWAQPDYMRIHLDHVPVIDEDLQRVDYLEIIREALELGYESVMVGRFALAAGGEHPGDAPGGRDGAPPRRAGGSGAGRRDGP
jgi:fructose/tagatose bisphosphate aldolase